MPINIYNPPCPHADPVTGGILQQSGQRCGNCICVARCYYINPIATGAQSTYPAMFMGPQLLRRNLAQFRIDTSEICHWDCTPPFPPGGLLSNGSSLPYGWSLYCLGSPFSGFNTGWILRAAGQSYPGGIPPQDTAFYTLQAPGHPTTDLNCRSPTDFFLDSNYGSTQSFVNFPAKITVQPFWP